MYRRSEINGFCDDMRYSGLQSEILGLYRALIRSAKAKDTEGKLVGLVKSEFRSRSTSIPRSDFKSIEHWMRYALKQKKLMEMPGFSAASVVLKDKIELK